VADTSQEVDAAERQPLQGEVARLGSVNTCKEVDGFGRGATLLGEAELGDRCVAVTVRESGGDLRDLAPFRRTKKS